MEETKAKGPNGEIIEEEFEVPDDLVLEFAALMDAHEREHTNVARIKLWRRVYEVFPFTRDGTWAIGSKGAIGIYVVKHRPAEPEPKPLQL